jgi:hypothetical protein
MEKNIIFENFQKDHLAMRSDIAPAANFHIAPVAKTPTIKWSFFQSNNWSDFN